MAIKRNPDDFVSKVEAERFNTDYLKFDPRRQAQKDLIEKRSRAQAVIQKAQDRATGKEQARNRQMAKMYWDAGRYAQGARDNEAVKAFETMKQVKP